MKTSVSAFGLIATLGSDSVASSVAADELSQLWQELDCMKLALEERQRLQALGKPITRKYASAFVSKCLLANAEAELAAVQHQVSVLKQELSQLNLRINERAQIINERGERIASLERTISGLKIKIETSRQRQVAMLRQAESILNDLAKR